MQKNNDILSINFFDAVKSNNVSMVTQLLDEGASFYAYNEENLTPLMVAAKYGCLDVIKVLVEKGVSLQQRSGRVDKYFYGITAEKVAQIYNQLGAENLLKSICYSNSRQYRNYVSALNTKDWDSLRRCLFCDYGNDINAQSNNGRTILMEAARTASCVMVKNLLDEGADVNRRDENLRTALHFASENNRGSIVVTDECELDNDLENHYHLMNCFNVVKSLVNAGIDIDAQDIHGKTALHLFLYGENDQIASFLIDKGANVNVKDDNGNTPLWIASLNGQIDLMDKLIANGANIDEVSIDNKTPLQCAYIYHQSEIVRFLVEKGANVNVPFEDGKNLVRFAVDRYDTQTLEMLLEFGGDMYAKDKRGKSAYDWALMRGDEDIVRIIRKYQSKPQKISQNHVVTGVHLNRQPYITR